MFRFLPYNYIYLMFCCCLLLQLFNVNSIIYLFYLMFTFTQMFTFTALIRPTLLLTYSSHFHMNIFCIVKYRVSFILVLFSNFFFFFFFFCADGKVRLGIYSILDYSGVVIYRTLEVSVLWRMYYYKNKLLYCLWLLCVTVAKYLSLVWWKVFNNMLPHGAVTRKDRRR